MRSGALSRWLTLAALAVVVLPVPARASFHGAEGRIAFASRVDGDFDIYSVLPDGSGLIQLTNHPAFDSMPRWSPDGQQLVFVSRRDGTDDLYVMDANGANVRRVHTEVIRDRFPSWTADGEQILFHGGPPFASDIYRVAADGTGEQPLLERPGADVSVATAPHGDRLIFSGELDQDGLLHLFSTDADGRHLRLRTAIQASDDAANWSPNGNDLAFVRDDTGLDNDVYVMHHNAQDLRRLTATPNDVEFTPVWSPAGGRLVIQRCLSFFTSPECDLYLLDAVSGATSRLTTIAGGTPDWQPIRPH